MEIFDCTEGTVEFDVNMMPDCCGVAIVSDVRFYLKHKTGDKYKLYRSTPGWIEGVEVYNKKSRNDIVLFHMDRQASDDWEKKYGPL